MRANPLLWVGLLLWVAGCSMFDARQFSNVKTYYRHDMKLTVNGQSGAGVLVAKPSPFYTISIEGFGPLDLLKIVTCHREIAIPNANPGGLFNSGRAYTFTYEPMDGIERERACPLRVEGYDRARGNHSFAFIDFEEIRHSMPARLDCNGSRSYPFGVSVCQARKGLKQVLHFTSPMRHRAVPTPFGHAVLGSDCSVEVSEDRKTFTFYQPGRECYFAFVEEKAPNRTYRHTSIGYEDIFVRGE